MRTVYAISCANNLPAAGQNETGHFVERGILGKPVAAQAGRRCSTARCFMCLASCKRCSLLVCLLGARASAARRSAPGTRLSSSAFGVHSLRSSTLGSSSVGSSLAVPHRSAPRCLIGRLRFDRLASLDCSAPHLSAPHRSAPQCLRSSSVDSSSVGSHRSTVSSSLDSSSLGSSPSSPRLAFRFSSSHPSPRPSSPATWLFDALHLEPCRERESRDTDKA